MRSTAKCLFLELPVELRLLIYDYALFNTDAVTIAAAAKCNFASPVDSGYESDDGRDSDELIPGLPSDFEPIVLPAYDPQLLSINPPPAVHYDSQEPADSQQTTADDGGDDDGAKPADEEDPAAQYRARLPVSTPLALLQTNRQINGELTWHLKSQRAQERKFALYLTYPYGVLVFAHLCPDLIRQVRSIHLSGYYYPAHAQEQLKQDHRNGGPAHSQQRYTTTRLYTQPPPLEDPVVKAANHALGRMVRTILSPRPKVVMEQLEMRIYHPGPKGNELIWKGDCRASNSSNDVDDDDDCEGGGAPNPPSPICVALFNTFGGDIDSSVTHGGRGAGAWLQIRPNGEARALTQRWRKFRDGSSKQECEGWVVNPEWPRPRPRPSPRQEEGRSSPPAPAVDSSSASNSSSLLSDPAASSSSLDSAVGLQSSSSSSSLSETPATTVS